jgi:hypothetical protein
VIVVILIAFLFQGGHLNQWVFLVEALLQRVSGAVAKSSSPVDVPSL